MSTLEQTKQTIINNLRQSTFQKVVDFANAIGDKCWANLTEEFYHQQNFTSEEKQDILNRVLQSADSVAKKMLIIFLAKEDENVVNQILATADDNMKRFIARYAASDNIRLNLLNQNPDKLLLKDIIAGMIDKNLVIQYKDSSDIELKQAYYTIVRRDNLVRRLWR